ncbi:MAG: methionine synthase [Euryarchaeota archaeon]|nr:methionine synthase [Euryarchaeota archaeon]
MEIIFDDIGSYPLPEGAKDRVQQAFADKRHNEVSEVVCNAMRQKIAAGVEIPAYPQFQDMNQQFLGIINDLESAEAPFLVKEDCADIIELQLLEPVAKEYFEENGERLRVRVCITGAIELYLKQFGGTDYSDILELFARSVDRFVKRALDMKSSFDVALISIDEPSIGINPDIMFDDDEIIRALDLSAKSSDVDTQIHLHSPLHYSIACESDSINVVGVESAANPDYLELVEKVDLEQYDTFLRVGVARTDIFGMTAELNERYQINVWKETSRLDEIVTSMETPEVVAKRLKRAYDRFGDTIKYAGPDCGLGSWQYQDLAQKLLANTSSGISMFKEGTS